MWQGGSRLGPRNRERAPALLRPNVLSAAARPQTTWIRSHRIGEQARRGGGANAAGCRLVPQASAHVGWPEHVAPHWPLGVIQPQPSLLCGHPPLKRSQVARAVRVKSGNGPSQVKAWGTAVKAWGTACIGANCAGAARAGLKPL